MFRFEGAALISPEKASDSSTNDKKDNPKNYFSH